jgi:hypothetical protein
MTEVNFLVKKGLTVPKGSASTPSVIFDASDPNTGLYSPGADQVAVATNGTGRLFVDASGRIGIAGSPSASSNTYLQVGYAGIGSDHVAYNYDSYFANNLYKSANSAWSRISTRAGGLLRIEDDTFTYSTADSGTAGASATLSERLRITSAGLVGIGTSSPGSRLEIGGDASYDATITFNRVPVQASNDAVIGELFFQNNADSVALIAVKRESAADDAYIQFATQQTAGGLSERVRITSAGNVGIGTTSPSSSLHVKGAADSYLILQAGTTDGNDGILFHNSAGVQKGVIFFDTDNDYMLFSTNNTERMRIDSSGRLLVGTSSTSKDFSAVFQGNSADATGGANLLLARGTSSPADGSAIGYLSFTDSNHNTAALIQAQRDGGTWDSGASQPGRLVFSTTANGASAPTERMRIRSDGRLLVPGVYAETTGGSANVNVQADGLMQRGVSSIKYKKDVETLEDSYADALLSVRPVWYRSTCQADNPAWGWWGFIAEEVAEIDPRLVHWKTTEPVVQENGTLEHVPCDPEPEGVAYDRFVPHLLNLIKRQGEAIADLQAEVAALKAQ